MPLKDKILEICALPDGVNLVGVAPVEKFLDLPEMGRPTTYLPQAQSVIGKNGLLITRPYGPRVRLSAVLTEAPLAGDEHIAADVCGDCDNCYKVCPSGALKAPSEDGKVNYDRFVCCSFLTANEGCGLCMSKCPL